MVKRIWKYLGANKSLSTRLDQKLQETTNPYLAARLEWNYLFGDIIKAKSNWRLTALTLAICNLFLVAGIIILSQKSHFLPYIVKVDDKGNALFGTYLDQKQTVSPLEVNAFLRQFIINARSVLIDPFAQKSNSEFVYAASLPAARHVLDSHYQSNNPFQIAKNGLIEIKIKGVIQKSKRTWQIDWEEIHRSLEGQELGKKRWEALITIGQYTVKNPEILNSNPLGLFIQQINWAEQV